MATVTIKIYQYCAGGTSLDFEVPATIVGDIAIHRPVWWFKNEDPKVSEKGWTVSHIPSGLSAMRLMPDSLQQRGATRKAIAAWAAEAQRRAAPIFTQLREGVPLDRDMAEMLHGTCRGVVV